MFTEFYEKFVEFFESETEEAKHVEGCIKAAALEIFNFRFSLASGAHGLHEIEQAILNSLKGTSNVDSNPTA